MKKKFILSSKGGLKAISLIELLIIIGIVLILTAMSGLVFRSFQREVDLDRGAGGIVSALRLSQNKTLASEDESRYGLYFDTSTSPHQYVLFKGDNYASRDLSADKAFQVPKTVELYLINLQGGSQVVFDRLTGTTSQSGNISLWLAADHSKAKTIYVESSGQISLGSLFSPSDVNRLKDSRHVHVDYNRIISVASENIVLNFAYNGSIVTEEIIIADNITDGQIYWEGEVEVNGEIQRLKIHTHRLNNPDSQFCFHRDRRENNQTLAITISGDSSGSLIGYSADGTMTNFTSIYVDVLNWQ